MEIYECLDMIRNGNPQIAETGFRYLLPRVKGHEAELIVQFGMETNHSMKCLLLELIGEARSNYALEFLKKQAQSQDAALRDWAVRGLRKLDNKAAREFLSHHGMGS